jgi:ankyrin repeat protein
MSATPESLFPAGIFSLFTEGEKIILKDFILLCININRDFENATKGIQTEFVKNSDLEGLKKTKKITLLLHPDKVKRHVAEIKPQSSEELKKKGAEETACLNALWQLYNFINEHKLVDLQSVNIVKKNDHAMLSFFNCFKDIPTPLINEVLDSLQTSSSLSPVSRNVYFKRKNKPSPWPLTDLSHLNSIGIHQRYSGLNLMRSGLSEVRRTASLELNAIIQDTDLLNLPQGIEQFIADSALRGGSQLTAFALSFLDNILTDVALSWGATSLLDVLFGQIFGYLKFVTFLNEHKKEAKLFFNLITKYKTHQNAVDMIMSEIGYSGFGYWAGRRAVGITIRQLGLGTPEVNRSINGLLQNFMGDTLKIRVPLRAIIHKALTSSGELLGGAATEAFVRQYIRGQIAPNISSRLNAILGDLAVPRENLPSLIPFRTETSDLIHSGKDLSRGIFELFATTEYGKVKITEYQNAKSSGLKIIRDRIEREPEVQWLQEQLRPSLLARVGSNITSGIGFAVQYMNDWGTDWDKYHAERNELITYLKELCTSIEQMHEDNVNVLLDAMLAKGAELKLDVLNIPYPMVIEFSQAPKVKTSTRDAIIIRFPSQNDRAYTLNLTPLMLATVQANVRMVRILLQSGLVDPNQEHLGISALHLAVALGYTNIVEIFCQFHKELGSVNLEMGAGQELVTPLGLAVYYGHLEIVDLLIQMGANTNAQFEMDLSILHLACRSNSKRKFEIIALLIGKGACLSFQDNDSKVAFIYLKEDLEQHPELVRKYLQEPLRLKLAQALSREPLDHEDPELRILIQIAYNLNILTVEQFPLLQSLFDISLNRGQFHYAEILLNRYSLRLSITPDMAQRYLWPAAISSNNYEQLVDVFLEIIKRHPNDLAQQLISILDKEQSAHSDNLRAFLAHQANLNYRTQDGRSLLSTALARNNYDFAALIFDKMPLTTLNESVKIIDANQNKWFFNRWLEFDVNGEGKKELILMYLYLASYVMDKTSSKFNKLIQFAIPVFKNTNDEKAILLDILNQLEERNQQLLLQSSTSLITQSSGQEEAEEKSDEMRSKEPILNEMANLDQIPVPGDGHCLYHAVALYLGTDQSALRQEVAQYIAAHRAEFAELIQGLNSDRSLDDFIRDIKNGVEWADHIEITVLMRITQRPIVVIGPNGEIRNRDVFQSQTGSPIFVSYNGVDHYNALIKRELKASNAMSVQSRTHSSAHIRSVKHDMGALLEALCPETGKMDKLLEVLLIEPRLKNNVAWSTVFLYLIKKGHYSNALKVLNLVPNKINSLARAYQMMAAFSYSGLTPASRERYELLFKKITEELIGFNRQPHRNERTALIFLIKDWAKRPEMHPQLIQLLANNWIKSYLVAAIKELFLQTIADKNSKAVDLFLEHAKALLLDLGLQERGQRSPLRKAAEVQWGTYVAKLLSLGGDQDYKSAFSELITQGSYAQALSIIQNTPEAVDSLAENYERMHQFYTAGILGRDDYYRLLTKILEIILNHKQPFQNKERGGLLFILRQLLSNSKQHDAALRLIKNPMVMDCIGKDTFKAEFISWFTKDSKVVEFFLAAWSKEGIDCGMEVRGEASPLVQALKLQAKETISLLMAIGGNQDYKSALAVIQEQVSKAKSNTSRLSLFSAASFCSKEVEEAIAKAAAAQEASPLVDISIVPDELDEGVMIIHIKPI